MDEMLHDFSLRSTVGVTAHPVWRFTCSECNWTHMIATADAPPVQQCPWCGCEEIGPRQAGAFASFVCSVHGRVTCLIENENIQVEDYMDLFCPHCRAIASGRPTA
jgi:hypothetical protein